MSETDPSQTENIGRLERKGAYMWTPDRPGRAIDRANLTYEFLDVEQPTPAGKILAESGVTVGDTQGVK